MGYELHIVRQSDYTNEEEESSISLNEWLAYVDTDKELNLTNGYRLLYPGSAELWQESPGFCEWVIRPPFEDGSLPWLAYGYGSISAKYPDDELIKKMILISKALNAKVRGDDFEYYDETYFTNGGKPVML